MPSSTRNLILNAPIFQACGLCTTARGFDQEGSDYTPGVEVTGLTELAEIVGECDRFLTFVP
jgi:sulfur relay (sulfurtransferase) complex TusBCD TusD component (DsrE family)